MTAYNDLLNFYTSAGAREFVYITENNDPKTLTPGHFCHHRFCSGVVYQMVMNLIKHRFDNGDRITKLAAGVRLYEEWLLRQKYNKVWN